MSDHTRDHAVVLGASMAGLLAATVLSRHYRRVTVVERDVLPAAAEHRRGVPQSRHTHALLASGVRIVEGLLPGLSAETVAAGAHEGDLLGGIRWIFSGHKLSQKDIGQPMLFCGRHLLEGQVRDRVRKLPGVEFADGREALGFLASADNKRVTGVRIGGAATETTLEADLVVDATGRGTRTPIRLQELGYQPPEVERITVDVGYSTRSYRLPEGILGRDKLILHGWTPAHPRGAGVVAIEGGRHLVTLAGLLGDHPPTDPQAFEKFADTLHFPDVRDVMREGEPLDDPVAFRYPANVRNRYERMGAFPAGLLVLGDAACAFNPLYGQGMTSSARQARALDEVLAESGGTPDWRRYFRRAAAAVDAPWTTATASDLVFPGVQGRRTAQTRLINAYLPRLHAAAATDPSLSEAFVRVTGLVDRPESLLKPRHVLRVLRGGRGTKES